MEGRDLEEHKERCGMDLGSLNFLECIFMFLFSGLGDGLHGKGLWLRALGKRRSEPEWPVARAQGE